MRFQWRRHRVQALTAIAGAVFMLCVLEAPTLTFLQLPSDGFPSSFHDRHGFFQVVRWFEHLSMAEELTKFIAAIEAFRARGNANPPLGASEGDAHSSLSLNGQFRTAEQLVAHLTALVAWESYMHISKACLQWGLFVFLSRAKALPKRAAVPSVCLCALVLICSRISQACLLEMITPRDATADPGQRRASLTTRQTGSSDSDRLAFMAAFLGMLFTLRFIATCIINVVLARAYQSYFGGYPRQWKDVPRYIGSKDFALSTLFYATAGVSIMVVSSRALRSLSEAVLQIETIALIGAFSHLLYRHFGDASATESTTTSAKKTD